MNRITFSCVAAEAHSVGLPIIASNCGGIMNTITPGIGIVVEVKDELALQRAMEKMIEKYETFSPGTRRAISNKFSYENVGKEIFNLYKRYT